MKKEKSKKSVIKKDDFKNISPEEFDSVMRKVLSAPPQKKKANKDK